VRLLRRWAERVLVLNPAMVEEAVACGFDRDQLGWMPNPVDVDRCRPVDAQRKAEIRSKLDVAQDAPLLLYVGRLAPEKELPSLLEAVAMVARSRPRATLVLVGDGPLRAELQEMAVRLGLAQNVRFTGAVAGDVVFKWLQAADIFALVSSLEGFPCSLAEAMSAGVAAVVSDIAGNTQLVQNGVHGLVAGCRDSAALGAAILRLIDNPALRAALGAAGRDSILENYSIAKVADRYERLFGAAEGQPGARPVSSQPQQIGSAGMGK
jgi:glycosyltransferase involved in cell wall biosynthesis